MNKLRTRCLALCLIVMVSPAFALYWRPLKPGIELAVLQPDQEAPYSALFAFRLDLSKVHLSLSFAKDWQKSADFINRFVQHSQGLLAINGGFFSPNFTPLGLRISEGLQRSAIKHTSWWGIFQIKNNRAQILSKQSYRPKQSIDFAIQAGPRLIVNGQIPKLKGGRAERSALGITAKGRVIIAITRAMELTTTELATILRRSEQDNGLNCANALNLDGGTSSQLYANINDFVLHIRSFRRITDAIVVKNK